MSKIKEIIVAAVLPTIKAVGKVEMENVFSGIKKNQSSDIYQNILKGLHSDFSILRVAALKSKTKIDDGIIDLMLEAIKESAEADGIVLS